MSVPHLTAQQRAEALAKAAAARARRAEIRDRLKHSKESLAAVLALGQDDDVIGRMRVAALLEAMPGIGKARAAQIMDRIGIATTRRVRGLGARQRSALLAEFDGQPPARRTRASGGGGRS
ncbi:MAG: integration host factor MihF [Acidothermus sp.]|nr:integration host factor MihF [Acidothermus sp.]